MSPIAKSMTAYGRSTGASNGKNITFEIKSVNSRYFDPSIKITRNYSFLEEKVKNYIQSRISRGKVDVWLGIEVIENVGCNISLDKAYAASYIKALEELRDEFSLKDDISVMRVAGNRDIFVFTQPEEDMEKTWEEVLPFVDEALTRFTDMRLKEGENLALVGPSGGGKTRSEREKRKHSKTRFTHQRKKCSLRGDPP